MKQKLIKTNINEIFESPDHWYMDGRNPHSNVRGICINCNSQSFGISAIALSMWHCILAQQLQFVAGTPLMSLLKELLLYSLPLP